MCLYRGEHDRSVGSGHVPLGGTKKRNFWINMTGKQTQRILDWIMNFSMSGEKVWDQRDIDYFIKNIKRNKWIDYAWDIYNFIVHVNEEENLGISVCLTFPLYNSQYPRKAPNYYLKTKALSKSSPPGISLAKDHSHEILLNNEANILRDYNIKYPGNCCYFIQKYDDGVYWRWIDIMPK